MHDENQSKYFFLAMFLLFFILTILIVKSFTTYIVLAIILTFSFYPLYKRINKKIKSENWASTILVIIIIALLVIPGLFAVSNLVKETSSAYAFLKDPTYVDSINNFFLDKFNVQIDIGTYINSLVSNVQSFLFQSVPNLITSIADIGLGLFIMFFIMFYAFKGGPTFFEDIMDLIPLKKKYKHKLVQEIKLVLHGVLYGQVMTAIIQGGVGGLMLFVFGVPNALFWGFVMVIFAFLPIVGTPLIWFPAGIFQIIQGEFFSGIMILIIGGLVITNIDNFIKPKLISGRSKIHPIVALIGVFGGLNLMGLIGLILGPVIIALFLVLLRFYNEDFRFGLETEKNE